MFALILALVTGPGMAPAQQNVLRVVPQGEVKVFDPGQGKPVRTSLIFGQQKINVRPRGADKVEWFTAGHEMPGSDDLCFLTSSTPDEVVAHLKACSVAIEEGPVTKQGARGALRSVYCRDPDGSLIEISSYEN